MELPARDFLTIVGAQLPPDDYDQLMTAEPAARAFANPGDAIREFEATFGL